MDNKEKRRWLDDHGCGVEGGHDSTGMHHVIWVTQGGRRFKGVGYTFDEMYGNLFDVVKQTLFLICCR